MVRDENLLVSTAQNLKNWTVRFQLNMEKLKTINFNGTPSWKEMYDRIRANFKASFTLDWLKHFWPVYLYWMACLFYPFIQLFAFYVYFKNGVTNLSIEMVRRVQFMYFPEIPMQFFALVTLLLIPYYIILKKYKYIPQVLIYFVFIFLGSIPFFKFFNFSVDVVAYSIICPYDPWFSDSCSS